ncbi:MAG: discoidin domain-containing protein, partial [Bifidobacteriaceae bacterium]|nr:discoidin domain-containing protein [Bifidobacteriaceae bacterium]
MALGLAVAPAAIAAITPAPPAGPAPTNIAATGTVTASSYFSEIDPANSTAGAYAPANVIDGSEYTSWVSRYPHGEVNGYPADAYTAAQTNNSWVQIDLPAATTVSEIVIYWGANCANEYQVQVSPDGVNWTTTDSFGRVHGACNVWWTLTKSHPVSTATPVKSVRIASTLARVTTGGMQINEVAIYGENPWAHTPAAPAGWSVTDPQNLSRVSGARATAKSQAQNSLTSPSANNPAYGNMSTNWAPAHAIDGLIASRCNSNYTGEPVGNTYYPTNYWFQVKLSEP